MFAAVNTSKLIRLRHSKRGSLEEQHFRALIGIWSRLVSTLLTDLSLRVKNLLQENSPMPSSVSVGLASFFSAFASSGPPGALWRSSLNWKPFKKHQQSCAFHGRTVKLSASYICCQQSYLLRWFRFPSIRLQINSRCCRSWRHVTVTTLLNPLLDCSLLMFTWNEVLGRWGSVVIIVTKLRSSQCWMSFAHIETSIPALRPARAALRWLPVFFPGDNAAGALRLITTLPVLTLCAVVTTLRTLSVAFSNINM